MKIQSTIQSRSSSAAQDKSVESEHDQISQNIEAVLEFYNRE